MINLKLNRKEKYILACSYGPDSMCLFDLLLKGGYNFVVAHVSYHLRNEEPREVEDLKNICNSNSIDFFNKDFHMPKGVNEEGWAREVRYDWFNELAKNLKIKKVLIAHNEDDLLETYLIQKRRNGIVSYYGLNKNHNIDNIEFIRPLLDFSKQELLDYCNENHVHYGFDLSNFDTSYLRNNIRQNLVKDMSKEDREKMLFEIRKLNEDLENKRYIFKDIYSRKSLKVCDLLKLDSENMQLCMIFYLNHKGIYTPISRGFAKELCSIVKTKKSWHKDQGYIFSLDYGEFGVYSIKDDFIKTIKINEKSKMFEKLKNTKYKIVYGLPLNTKIKVGNGTKKLGRCFIDWKLPYVYRRVWPIVVDENNNVLYVPTYKKDYNGDNATFLEFNLENFVV